MIHLTISEVHIVASLLLAASTTWIYKFWVQQPVGKRETLPDWLPVQLGCTSAFMYATGLMASFVGILPVLNWAKLSL